MIKSFLRRLSRLLPRPLVGWIAYYFPTLNRAYGQFGEDLVLARLLPEAQGWYVDIGAFHPRVGSNTHFLWKRGWRGINIDVDDYKIALFRRFRPNDVNLSVGVSCENATRPFYVQTSESYGSMSSLEPDFARHRGEKLGRRVSSREVSVRTLNSLLEQYLPRRDDGSFGTVDFLNIDVEGHEYEILRALDFDRFRPRCVCVEIHADGLNALAESSTFRLLLSQGYQMVAWPTPSCIFIATGLPQSSTVSTHSAVLRKSA